MGFVHEIRQGLEQQSLRMWSLETNEVKQKQIYFEYLHEASAVYKEFYCADLFKAPNSVKTADDPKNESWANFLEITKKP